MKKTLFPSFYLIALFGFFFNPDLSAQNTEAIITDFQAFSFFNNGVIADTLFYNPDTPTSGAAQYFDDSLEVFTEAGAFELNYIPEEDSVFVAIWIDRNGNGLFEKEEQAYRGTAKAGNLKDDLVLPVLEGSHRALVAISKEEKDLIDPREIVGNDQISSLQFIIRSGPPTLTMGSKKDTRDTSELFCMQIPMELQVGPGHPCISVYEWQFDYPVGNSVPVNANVTLSPAGTSFSVGTNVYAGDYIEFDFDFSSYAINDGESVDFTLFYTYCSDPDSIDSVTFTFTKDCMVNSIFDKANAFDNSNRLSIQPNPIRSEAKLGYELFTSGQIQLMVSDINGRWVDQLQSEYLPAGEHQLIYRPDHLAPGVYWLFLRTPRGISSKKIVVLRP